MRGFVLSTIAIVGLLLILYAWISTPQVLGEGDSAMFLEISVSDLSDDSSSNELISHNDTSSSLSEMNNISEEEELAYYYQNKRSIIRSEHEDLEKELNFLVIGDYGYTNEQKTKNLANLIYEKVKKTFIQYDFLLSVGDNFYNKGVEKLTDNKPKQLLEEIFRINELGLDWYPVLGNHDCSGNLPATFQIPNQYPHWKQTEPYYHKVFNIGSSEKKAAFIFLNGCDLACKNQYSSECFKAMWDNINWNGIQTQINWIKETLDTISQDPNVVWKVIINHWAIFSAGSKHGDNEVMKEILLPMLTEYKVDLVLSGHDHNLQYLRMNFEDCQVKVTTDQAPKQEGVVGDLLDKFLKKGSTQEDQPTKNETEQICPMEVDYTYCSLDEYFHTELTKCGVVKKDDQQSLLHSLYQKEDKYMLDLYNTKFSRESTSNKHEFLHQFVIGGGGPDLEKVCPLKHQRSLGKLRYSNSIPGLGEIKIKEDRIEAKLISAEDDLLYTVKIFKNN